MTSRRQNKATERNLIEKYDIVFDGPIPSREWPIKYVPIFQKFREIEDVKYERYIGTLITQNQANHYSCHIFERVADLIRAAYDMRKSLANEATWREGTESLVVSRFHTDIAW
jgi:hypothetical protein